MKWLSKESCNKTPQSSHWKRDKPRLNTLGRHYLTSFHIPEAETGGSETFELYWIVFNGCAAKSPSKTTDFSWILSLHLPRGLLHRRVFERKWDFELVNRKNQWFFQKSQWENFTGSVYLNSLMSKLRGFKLFGTEDPNYCFSMAGTATIHQSKK